MINNHKSPIQDDYIEKYADKKKLADEAIYLERNLCQEAGGWQDQIAASFGGSACARNFS